MHVITYNPFMTREYKNHRSILNVILFNGLITITNNRINKILKQHYIAAKCTSFVVLCNDCVCEYEQSRDE